MNRRTFKLVGYQPHGTSDRNAYTVDVMYRARRVATFDGADAVERAARYCAAQGAGCVVDVLEPRA